MTPYVSLVIPCYNEEATLDQLYARLLPVLNGLNKPYEIILINDGSRDKTSEKLQELFQSHAEVTRVFEFNRNYGQHTAIMAGFAQVRGEVIITMDADLQNFPEDIPLLLEKFEAGYDVVGGARQDRQDSWFRCWISRLHNQLRLKITKINMQDDGCMLRAYKRSIVDQMVACEENSTFITALATTLASNPIDIPVRHAARVAGKSNYNLYKLIRYNFDFFANFSRAPLEFFTFAGCTVALFSMALFVYIIARRIFLGPDGDGVFTLFAILYFLVGIVLVGLGIVGEYVGRIYEEVRKRPRYVIKRSLSKE